MPSNPRSALPQLAITAEVRRRSQALPLRHAAFAGRYRQSTNATANQPVNYCIYFMADADYTLLKSGLPHGDIAGTQLSVQEAA